jgi:two-component system, OmpR family, sensor kinase
MRRLHLQIFGALALTSLSSVLLVLLIGSLFGDDGHKAPSIVRDMGALVVEGLPDRDRPGFERGLMRRARRLKASISVWDRDGALLGKAGRALAPPQPGRRPQGFTHTHDALFVTLDDGRMLGVAFHEAHSWFGLRRSAVAVCCLLLVLLVGSYLAARRITRRLEQLERGVTRFGEGDLGTRVAVEGRDEVAQLARAFNRSFERISGLLTRQRRMLQSASHELRSPLARVRMAFELVHDADPAAEARIRADVERDIAELDALIADLLLAGRLSDTELPKDFAPLALADIVREETRRVHASYAEKPEDAALLVSGNARMLRSLVRNLLENAKRHGREPVSASLALEGRALKLWLDDQGGLLPEEDRERIFEPFYRPLGHREGKDGGVGLGLALVRSIAEHHGGSVRYVAYQGHSRFEVTLPLVG